VTGGCVWCLTSHLFTAAEAAAACYTTCIGGYWHKDQLLLCFGGALSGSDFYNRVENRTPFVDRTCKLVDCCACTRLGRIAQL
jgi:hypothetical protein